MSSGKQRWDERDFSVSVIENAWLAGRTSPRRRSRDRGGVVTAVALPFEEAVLRYALSADLVVVGVDNNRCRWSAATFARNEHIPAVFSMLSPDGMRTHTFLQGADEQDACLWYALPNLDPTGSAPCALGIVTSCFAAAAHMTFFAHRALMGWPEDSHSFNWRASDLVAITPEETGSVKRRPQCRLCGGLSILEPPTISGS